MENTIGNASIYTLAEFVATFKRTYSIKKYVILIVLHVYMLKKEGLVVNRRNGSN